MGIDQISAMMNQAISQGIFPGAVLLCAVDQKLVFNESFGSADIVNKKKMQKDSVFDLASLTKPLATTLAISKLIENDKIFAQQEIGSILKQFKFTPKSKITIDMLLRHTSGLPAYEEYYKKIKKQKASPREFLRDLILKQELENPIDSCQLYSDIGFMILSWIIEEVAHQRLDRFVFDAIFNPLEINTLFFNEISQPQKQPLSIGNRFVATQHCPWRNKLLIGEVDDDNAWAVGGIEGHAGLFGDAFGVFTLCCELLKTLQGKPTKVLNAKIIRQFVQKQGAYDMVAGFDTPSKDNSSAGNCFSEHSIGHLGFTGTSFWVDPEVSLIVILLTNRVHPLRSNEGIKEFRPKLHDLIYSLYT